MQKIAQRIGLVCGALCLLVALALVLIGNLSSRYILEQQDAEYGQALAKQLARQIAPVIANGNLIGLEVSLEEMRQRHSLLMLAVNDLEERPLGSAGNHSGEDSNRFSASIPIDGNLAGELSLVIAPAAALMEQQRMAMGLLFLALLFSIFVAVLAAKWAQPVSDRLMKLQRTLSVGGEPAEAADRADELTELEQAVAQLPVELLQAPEAPTQQAGDYAESALLYVRLQSLEQYVETLDEQSLLAYTERQRQLTTAAASLYGGSLSVVRQFGLLLSFTEQHTAGSPGFRAASSAWLLMQLSAALQQTGSLKQGLSMAGGIGEASRGTGQDIYPALYNQHVIDELCTLTPEKSGEILLNRAIAADPDISNRCRLEARPDGVACLAGFEEPYCDLLERQRELLLRELAIGV